jgi:hypothetical protein
MFKRKERFLVIILQTILGTLQPSFDTSLPSKNIFEGILIKVYRVPTDFIETMHCIIFALAPCCSNHIPVFIMSSPGCLESERPLPYPIRQSSTSQKNWIMVRMKSTQVLHISIRKIIFSFHRSYNLIQSLGQVTKTMNVAVPSKLLTLIPHIHKVAIYHCL